MHRAILHGKVPVAVKLLIAGNEAPPPSVVDAMIEELQIMCRVPDHPNIVKCYGGSQTPPNIFLVEVSGAPGG